MARALNKLSSLAVDRRKVPGRASDGGGLYLSVSPTGSKSWVFMWVRNGRRREMGLGPYPAVSLIAARTKAADCRAIVADGRDPIEQRSRSGRKMFGECADAYIDAVKSEWKNAKHAHQWRQSLTQYCGRIRDLPVDAIGTDEVLGVLTPIWQTRAETASRLRGRIERVLDYAAAHGWRSGENPARWRGHLKNVLPKRQKLYRGHHAAMDYREVPTFLRKLRQHEAMAARALEFAILTAARSGEVLNARWDEIDLDEAVWTVPAVRMKAGQIHRVPLSPRALDVLRPLRELSASGYVFPGHRHEKPLSGMAMQMLLRRMKVDNATVHGFRSSFRDWCGDCTTFPREIAEAALAHKVGDEVERAYRRRDAIEKRRQLMDAWAAYCSSKTNVVSLAAVPGP